MSREVGRDVGQGSGAEKLEREVRQRSGRGEWGRKVE